VKEVGSGNAAPGVADVDAAFVLFAAFGSVRGKPLRGERCVALDAKRLPESRNAELDRLDGFARVATAADDRDAIPGFRESVGGLPCCVLKATAGGFEAFNEQGDVHLNYSPADGLGGVSRRGAIQRMEPTTRLKPASVW